MCTTNLCATRSRTPWCSSRGNGRRRKPYQASNLRGYILHRVRKPHTTFMYIYIRGMIVCTCEILCTAPSKYIYIYIHTKSFGQARVQSGIG